MTRRPVVERLASCRFFRFFRFFLSVSSSLGTPRAIGAVRSTRVFHASGGTAVLPNSVRAFGTSQFGDLAGQPLNQPLVGMAATLDGRGYWLVARDGGIFTSGDAGFSGNALGDAMSPAVGISGSGGGYRVVYGQSVDPLGPVAMNYLSQREGNVTAALFDADTGATFQLNPGDAEEAASIVKVEIMATALLEAQEDGRGIPPTLCRLTAR